jgi:hypothetical protein
MVDYFYLKNPSIWYQVHKNPTIHLLDTKYGHYILDILNTYHRSRSKNKHELMKDLKLKKNHIAVLFRPNNLFEQLWSTISMTKRKQRQKIYFLAHLCFWSPVVLLSVRLSVNFYIFDFFSRTTGPILTTLSTNHPWKYHYWTENFTVSVIFFY